MNEPEPKSKYHIEFKFTANKLNATVIISVC